MNEIKMGIVGLGRMGFIHAENVLNNVPEATLYAACSSLESQLETAKTQLGVKEVYTDYEEMLESSDLDAVIIVSPSSLHTKHIQQAMEKGLHVFCEKPIGIEIEDIKETVDTVDRHPDQVFQLGFMRRYDESYQHAKAMVDAGEIGEVTLIRCYGIDPSSGLESFVNFAKNSNSGGLFVDMSIHDIDLIRWFTNQEISKVWAIGKNAAYPELDEIGDLETGAAMMQLEDETMALLVAGRNAVHGYHVETEIMGTKGMIRIGQEPEKNLVTVFDDNGVLRPTPQNFPERFKRAFIEELRDFTACIKENRHPEVSALDGLKGTVAAEACQTSLKTNQLVNVNQ